MFTQRKVKEGKIMFDPMNSEESGKMEEERN